MTTITIEKGRWYPQMPPSLDGEDDDRYSNRLIGVYGDDQVPYDHPRNRQCSLGWHMECSDPAGQRCKCPCHTDGRVERPWTGVEVGPFEAYCTRCRWVGAASDGVDAIRKANAHQCPDDPSVMTGTDVLPCESCRSTDVASVPATGQVFRWTCRSCERVWYSIDPTGIPIRTRQALTRLTGGVL